MAGRVLSFALPRGKREEQERLLCVGGGAIEWMKGTASQSMRNSEFRMQTAAVDSDAESLGKAEADMLFLLGREGKGTRGDSVLGRELAEGSLREIRDWLEAAGGRLFMIVELGGGTGSAAAAVIAREARRIGLLTIAIAALPAKKEGTERRQRALSGLERLRRNSDATIVADKEQMGDSGAGSFMLQTLIDLNRLLIPSALSGFDWGRFHAFFREAGQVFVASATAEGAGRITDALTRISHSMVLEGRDLFTARRLHLSIYTGQISLWSPEMDECQDWIAHFGENIEFSYALYTDAGLGSQARLVAIAVGVEATASLNSEFSILNSQLGATRPYIYRFAPHSLDDERVIELVAATPTYSRRSQTINQINQIATKTV